MNQPDLNLLRKAISRFIPLDDAHWEMLAPHVREKTVLRHALFAAQGKMAYDVGLVVEGSMRHYYTVDGIEKTTYFYFENHFVSSYISCMTGRPSDLAIEAITDCRLLVFPYRELKRLFDLSHQWERFGRLVAEYLATGLEERMAGLLALSPEQRYLQLLEGNRHKIPERIPQQYIASYLGITPVSLSRIRKRISGK